MDFEFNMINIYIHTFGCKLNKYESEKLSHELKSLGFNISSLNESDAVAINTCTVTKDSDTKLKLYVEKLNVEKPIFLIGCYVSKKNIKNDDIINAKNIFLITNDEKENAASIIYNSLIKTKIEHTKKSGLFFPQEQSRAFIKIQDGCSVFCSYCIVSHVRGQNKNIEPSELYKAIEEASENNYKEIVLTGLNLASYNYENTTFSSLIENAMETCSKFGVRLRLSSIEPIYFDEKLIKLFNKKNTKLLAPHVHIPLQSGSDRILKLMDRRYNSSFFLNIIENIYKENENISITTDVMVGFPNEDELDFLNTYNVCEKSRFLKMHIFRYSKREGTKAYDMDNQIGIRQKVKRAHLLNKLNLTLEEIKYRSFLGKNLDVIIENICENNIYEGTSGEYLKVKLYSEEPLNKKMLTEVVAEEYEKRIILART